MIRIISILLLLLCSTLARAQSPKYLELVKAESRLHNLFTELYSDSLSGTDSILELIHEIMPEALSAEGAMDYPWSKFDQIGVITSADKRIRVFTWHVADDADHYRYFGYIQVGLKKSRVRVFELVDNLKPQRELTKVEQTTGDWYGKLYYKIVTRKYKRKQMYTLLGMDFNNSRSVIKSVEAMVIQRNRPEFAKELFFNGRDNVDRVVFEYSTQVSMTVNYDPELDMITFDHLVPFHPIYEGNYEFYGPDGSFDGLEFTTGTWVLREDLDARNQN
jgi:hypothetical protein